MVATADADGYTLLLGGTNVNAIAGALYKNLGFDPVGSFARSRRSARIPWRWRSRRKFRRRRCRSS
jgi:hypothetical protein